MAWFWTGVLKQGAYTAESQSQLAPNDGNDTLILPLEDPPPLPYTPPPYAILRAWRPDVTVTILRPPAGAAASTDNPPRVQSYAAEDTVRRAWGQDWAAQPGERNAALLGSIDNPPTAAPNKPTPWSADTWAAQSAAKNAAWNVDNPPPRGAAPSVWSALAWNAQRAVVSNAWDVPADNPPPFIRQLSTILAAWQPNYSVTLLRPTGGGNVAADSPPLRNGPRVDALWQVTWPAQGPGKNAAWNVVASQVDNPPPKALPIASGWAQDWKAQSTAPNAGWNVVVATPDNPPPQKPYPPQVFAAWQPDVRITLLRPTGGGDVPAAGDNPPPRQDYAKQQIAALWQSTWRAQTLADNAAWNFVLVTPDDPPFGRRAPSVTDSWYATWKQYDVRLAAGSSQSADDPPPRQTYAADRIVALWQQTWKAQGPEQNAAWNFVPPQVDDPPFRQDFGIAKTLPKWNQAWAAQGVAPNAAWNVDNPPPRQDYAKQQVVALWQMTWAAQGPSKNAAWNFIPPVIDDPQPRNQYGVAQIVGAMWQQNWLAQAKSPIGWIFPEPPVVVVPPQQFDDGSRSGSSGGEPSKKKKPKQPIQRRAGAKNTYVSLDSGKVYGKSEVPASKVIEAPAKIAIKAAISATPDVPDELLAMEEQEAAEILALLDKLFR